MSAATIVEPVVTTSHAIAWPSGRRMAMVAGVATLLGTSLLAWQQEPRPNPFEPVRVLSSDWWLHPQETNAFLRLAALDADLKAVHVAADGRHLWAVGSAGVILHSADGGAHWERQAVDYSAVPGAPSVPPADGASPSRSRPASRAAAPWLESWVPLAHAQQFPAPNAAERRTTGAPTTSLGPTAPVNPPATTSGARSNVGAPPGGTAAVPAKDPASERDGGGGDAGAGAGVNRAVQGPTNPSPANEIRPSTAQQPSGPVPSAVEQTRRPGLQGAGTTPCAAILDVAARDDCLKRAGTKSTRAAAPARPQNKATSPSTSVVPQASGSTKTPAAVTTTRLWADPDLSGIAFAGDGKRGAAVGTNGILLVTVDGGAMWKALPLAAVPVRAVAIDEPSNQLATVADDGKRVLPLDAALGGRLDGALYARHDLGLMAIWRDGAQWIAFASNGTWWTSDNGAKWIEGPKVDGEYCAHLPRNDGTLIAMKRDGSTRVLRAVRGRAGLAWEAAGELASDVVVALAAGEGSRVVAFTRKATVYESVNGGGTWVPSATMTSALAVPSAVVSAAQAQWLVGSDGAVQSVDRGGRVRLLTQGAHGRYTAAAFDVSDRNARSLWIAAASGTMFRSQDGGARFEPIFRLPFAVANLWFENTLNGVARGIDGAEYETRDGGSSWTSRPKSGMPAGAAAPAAKGAEVVAIPDPLLLRAKKAMAPVDPVNPIAHAADDVRFAAVGAAGSVLVGDKSGSAFTSPLAPYSRAVAPWVYPAGLIGLAFLLFAALAPPRPVVRASSVADILASDKPLERVTGIDPLKLGPLAAGLSRFLRNEATEPPLTLAITGEWGSGKSSLMNLLARELRTHGVSVVTFNAWHHQKEEHLLASLLTAVRNQAPPHWFSLAGVEFRWHLGLARARRAPVHTALVFFVLGAVMYLAFNPGPMQPFANLIKRLVEFALNPAKPFEFNFDQIPQKLVGASAFLTAVGVGFGALRQLRAFGVDPAQLAANVAANFSLKDASAQASFRERFARDFREVTTAMKSGSRPRVLTIFIDDLDRCRPEAVLEVLEAVNFLVSSGDCYVTLGMARTRVEACVGLAFEKIAVEMVNLEREPGAVAAEPDQAREKRREYARQYLEKLINVEVPMPTATIEQARAIVNDEAGRRPAAGGMFAVPTWLAAALGFWPLLLAAGVFTLGVLGAKWLTPSVEQPNAVLTQSAPPASAGGSAAGSANSPTLPLETPPTSSGALRDAQDGGHAWVVLAVLGLLGGAGLFAAWMRRADPVVRDSLEFKRALEIWLPVVLSRQNTPRAIKRFINRVRYLAMLRGDAKSGEPDPGPLLVMLTAIQHADPAYLHQVTAFADGDARFTAGKDSSAAVAIVEALKLHGATISGAIDPTRFLNERRWFEENASSARMA